MHHSNPSCSSPPLVSIAKKINPSATEAVAVGRRAGEDKTLEAALEPGRPSRSGLRSPGKQNLRCQTSALAAAASAQAVETAQTTAYPQSENPELLCLSGDPPELLASKLS